MAFFHLLTRGLLIPGAIFAMSTATAQASAVAELYIDGATDGIVKAGQPSDWTFSFYYMSTGEPVTDYEPFHTKYMHMFVISQDLAEFSHLHPEYDAANHNFKLKINSLPIDDDNFSQPNVIKRSGEYHVITEVKIKDTPEETHGMHFVDSEGGPAMGSNPAVEFTCDGAPHLRHMDRQGVQQSAASYYQIEVSCQPAVLAGFKTVEFKYSWRYLKNGTTYSPVTDFTHWLHMTGHALAVSLKGDSVGSKTFKHMHNMSPHGSSAPMIFNVDQAHGGLDDGSYKVWAQFKRDNRVLTLPIVVEFKPAAPHR